MDLLVKILIFLMTVAFFGCIIYVFMWQYGMDNFKGITLFLEDWYKSPKDMVPEVMAELEKKGKKCECIKPDGAFPVLLIEGEKYYLTYRVIPVGGGGIKVPTQMVQLKKMK